MGQADEAAAQANETDRFVGREVTNSCLPIGDHLADPD
jgi:hypothetical protein